MKVILRQTALTKNIKLDVEPIMEEIFISSIPRVNNAAT